MPQSILLKRVCYAGTKQDACHGNRDFILDINSIIEEIEPAYKFRIFKPVDGMVSTEILLICETDV